MHGPRPANTIRANTILLILFVLAVRPAGAAEPSAGIHFAPDVVDQFNSLGLRGDGLAFGVGDLPKTLDMSTCKHFQGIVRLQAADGTPYLFLTRSGNDPGFQCVTGDDPGNLFVVRMGSRDKNGERLRTNRLKRDWFPFVRDAAGQLVRDLHGLPIPWTKPPDPRDATVALVSFENGLPYYGHPGGMQLAGDVLAFAAEEPYGGGPESVAMFFDVFNPESPRLTSVFPLIGDAGLVALTPVRNPDGPGLRYIMMATGGNNEAVRLYRSTSTDAADPAGPTDLKSPQLRWDQLITVTKGQLETCSGVEWPSGGPIRQAYGHQMINFVREGSLDGPLYAIGGRNAGLGGEGEDLLDLYRVNVDVHGNPSPCLLSHVSTRHMTSFPFNGHGDSASLSAAGGVYISPSGELIVYGAEYFNEGPFELRHGTPGYRTVRFVEWRHLNVVRSGSPTLHPTASIDGPFTVDEGSSVPVTGAGRPAITKAWMQLFQGQGAGVVNGFDYDWLQIDYDDRGADAFDDLIQFDGTTGTDFWENSESWRWFAPPGCTISANNYPSSSANFPGPGTQRLVGTGSVAMAPTLGGFNNDIEGVTFHHVDDDGLRVDSCDAYYNAPIGFAWDLDGNGAYETDGTSATFSATALDGPSTVSLGARAQHPTDHSPLGTGFATAEVRVQNVAPAITLFGLFDSLGSAIGTTVPFAIQGSPITARGSFTDPGRPDHQTATLNWGDGRVEPSAAFDVFTDAFGGATGQASRRHVHAQPGAYTVTLTVADDDGGAASALSTVRVLSPVQAVGEIIGLIDRKLAAGTTSAQRTALLNARKALAGSVEGLASNGALDKLEDDLISAALTKLRQAIGSLQEAQAAGCDVGGLVALLRQIVAVLEIL
jgi:hypothetical protein